MPRRHGPIAALAIALLLSATALSVTTAAPARAEDPTRAEDPAAYPASIAALGDSITRGFNACGWYFDCTARSWSTGDSDRVNGHYRRLLTLNPAIEGNRHNNAETGATSADLAAQVKDAIDQNVDYVTVLIGANDACADTLDGMTGTDQYRLNVSTALTALKQGLPQAHVFVSSIPDLYRLWAVNKDNQDARDAWASAGICQALLADPESVDPAVEQRRMAVRQRVLDYNAVLSEQCTAYGANCRYDGGVVFNTEFTAAEVSGWDYFHPNAEGQRHLADATFPLAFDPR